MKIKAKITGAALTALIVMLSGCVSSGSNESSNTSSGEVTRSDIFGVTTTADGASTSAPAETTADNAETSADNSETSAESSLQPFANGRESGKTTTAGIGEDIDNEFFRWRVNEADTKFNVDGYVPNNIENTHLRVNITLKNNLTKSIPIGVYDFELIYTFNGEECTISPIDEEFTTGQFPIEDDLALLGSKTGDVYFIVPYGITDFTLSYTEFYEDDFIGNINLISFTAEEENKAEHDAAVEESTAKSGEDADANYTLNETFENEVGDTVTTEYLSFIVNDVKRLTSVDGADSYEGYDYLEVSMKIKNTCDYSIPVYNYDFVVLYEQDGEPYYATNITNVSTLNDTVEIAAGETLTVVDYYLVPAELTEFSLNYYDYYNDTEYNSYNVNMSAYTKI